MTNRFNIFMNMGPLSKLIVALASAFWEDTMKLENDKVLTLLENDKDTVSQSGGVVDSENCANPREGGVHIVFLGIYKWKLFFDFLALILSF